MAGGAKLDGKCPPDAARSSGDDNGGGGQGFPDPSAVAIRFHPRRFWAMGLFSVSCAGTRVAWRLTIARPGNHALRGALGINADMSGRGVVQTVTGGRPRRSPNDMDDRTLEGGSRFESIRRPPAVRNPRSLLGFQQAGDGDWGFLTKLRFGVLGERPSVPFSRGIEIP